MPFEKICAYKSCGRTFTAKYSAAKFCSRSCIGKAKAPQDDQAIRQALLKRIRMPKNQHECWVWIGYVSNSTGYGAMHHNGRPHAAHRLVYEYFVAPIPPYLHILHGRTCKMKTCVNPQHLRIGTNLDNIHDRMAFGNNPQGSLHHNTSMTETIVLHILQDYHDKGISDLEIAEQRKRNINTIRDILHRRTWKHVAPNQYHSPGDTRARVTETIVREIRRLREYEGWANKTITDHMNALFPGLGLKYNVTSNICHYRSWKHVTPDPQHTCPNTDPYCTCCRECLAYYGAEQCENTDDHLHATP